MKLQLRCETWPFAAPFRITDYVFSGAEILVAGLSDGEIWGWGEAAGVYYRGETPQSMAAQIESVREAIEGGLTRAELRSLLPAGGARNALDAALWDLEACRHGEPAWRLAGIEPPRPLLTTFTVSAASPDEMAKAALAYGDAKAIKLKLTREDPAACVRAVRAVRPDVWLGVDANQGLTRGGLERLLPAMVEAQVSLIEQPLPAGQDQELAGMQSPIPLAADESAQQFADLDGLAGLYQVVNIKLDKCGGLTEGLAMAAHARRLGLQVMVGCMSGTSLAMAPAFLLGQLCDLVDLDGPTFLSADRPTPAAYASGRIWCPPELWGARRLDTRPHLLTEPA